MTSVPSLASWLRAQPALVGEPPALDVGSLPDEPVSLFTAWVRHAAEAGVAEPHAATLATVDADGMPDARTLIVKDVTAWGWAFAGPRRSAKGDQLAANPAAALNLWWQPLRRAVRVRGAVCEAAREESDADLEQRTPAAREGMSSGDWVRWWLLPARVEFWQGAVDRRHIRIVYERRGDEWSRTVLNGEGAAAPGKAT